MTPLDAYHAYAARFNFAPTINPPATPSGNIVRRVAANT